MHALRRGKTRDVLDALKVRNTKRTHSKLAPIAAVCLCATIWISTPPLHAQGAEPDSALLNTPSDDSLSLLRSPQHRKLRAEITKFESEWRTRFLNVQDAGRVRAVGSPIAGLVSESELPRYFYMEPMQLRALSCSFLTVGNADVAAKRGEINPITTWPSNGIQCPVWEPWPYSAVRDESRNIDAALAFRDKIEMRARRELLIEQLLRAQKATPNDVWISQQLVRFVNDQIDPNRTVAIAQTCQGNTRSCDDLAGYALWRSGRMVAADSLFRRGYVAPFGRKLLAPTEMVSPTFATPLFTDTRECLDAEDYAMFERFRRQDLRQQSCSEQRAVMANLWWLADPLWSLPGNERFVEHRARAVYVLARSDGDQDERNIFARPYGGNAMRELIIRYGPQSSTYFAGGSRYGRNANFNRNAGARSFTGNIQRVIMSPRVVNRYNRDRSALIPSIEAIRDPLALSTEHFRIHPDTGDAQLFWQPYEQMRLALKIDSLPAGQSAMLRRDTSVIYQRAIDDPLPSYQSKLLATAHLAGGTTEANTRILATTQTAEGYTLRLRTFLAPRPIVLSAEVLPRAEGTAALRSRYAVRPPPSLRQMSASEFALSEPVLMRLPNSTMLPPSDEASVLRLMAGTTTITTAEPVAFYWESYGFAPGDTVQIELKIRRDDDRSTARRVGSALGLASALRDSVSIRWTEPDGQRSSTVVGSSSTPTIGRTIAVNLNALAAGDYVAIIEMRKGTSAARSERKFTVRD
ncbi:MAG: hypothetical protein H7Z40_06675 [Phycisphaerae bacterium]|nr:hypothetical protein [Gemmatimonadaceae bacterium]